MPWDQEIKPSLFYIIHINNISHLFIPFNKWMPMAFLTSSMQGNIDVTKTEGLYPLEFTRQQWTWGCRIWAHHLGCLFPSLHINHPPSVVIFSFQTEYNMIRLQLCSAHIIIYNHIRQRLLPKLESARYQNATAAIFNGGTLFQMANLIYHVTLLFDFISKTLKFEKYFALLPRSKGLS